MVDRRKSIGKGGPRAIHIGRKRKLFIPQAPDRPIKLKTRDVVLWDELRKEPGYLTIHRRGIKRSIVGEDPNEARAVSREQILGTLPERILYKELMLMRFVPDVDFTFQSSLQGGRLEFGGIVVDFEFPFLKVIIQVQGPTHDQYMRVMKDKEQDETLQAMGYTVWYLDMQIILDDRDTKKRIILNRD